MKQVNGCWLPDDEPHFPEHLARCPVVDGFPDYQGDKRREALRWVKQRRVAVDVGAHVGLWSRPLAAAFSSLFAFEPDAGRRECWQRNMAGEHGVLLPMALDDKNGLDTQFALATLDLLKVDTEGSELRVLQGARAVLERCRPVVCVEQKPGYPERHSLPAKGAIEYLEALGAIPRAELSGVYVLSWD